MKKITFLVAAMLATTMAVNANVIEIANFNWIADSDTTSKQADQTVEKDGVTLKFNGTILDATYNNETYRTLRVYAGKTLTVSCTEKITKIEVIGYAKKGANITASAGTVNGGSFSADTYAYENGFDEPLFVINDVNATSTVITPVKQIRLYGIRVTTSEDGETPDEGDEGDEGETNYSFEPTEKTAINETMDYADWTDHTDYGIVSVYMENDDFAVDLWVITNDAAMPVGTFAINDSEEENTVIASIGGDDDDDYPSCVYADFDEEDYYNAAYYLVSGSLSIEQDGANYNITLDAVSYYGSTIKMTYTGEVEEYTTAIRNVEVMNDVYANAGRIYAEEGARIYTVTGLDVTRMNGSLNGIYIVKAGNKVGKIVVR